MMRRAERIVRDTDSLTEKDLVTRYLAFFSSNFTSNQKMKKGDHFVQANKYLNVVGRSFDSGFALN